MSRIWKPARGAVSIKAPAKIVVSAACALWIAGCTAHGPVSERLPLPAGGAAEALTLATLSYQADLGDPRGLIAPAPVVEPAALIRPVKPKVALPRSRDFQPAALFKLCAGFPVRNAPTVKADLQVERFSPFALVNGRVALARVPVQDACMTSGFGMRRGRAHKGLDIQGPPPAAVRAAGAGTVVEALYRRGYGYTVLIDHGHGVYSRYAHLKGFAKGVAEGARLAFGAVLGPMGATGRASGAHLHYEILTGTYDREKRRFGLKAHDPLGLPAAIEELPETLMVQRRGDGRTSS